MKYRNIFKTMEEYNNSSLSYPNISLITDDNKVIIGKPSPYKSLSVEEFNAFKPSLNEVVYVPITALIGDSFTLRMQENRFETIVLVFANQGNYWQVTQASSGTFDVNTPYHYSDANEILDISIEDNMIKFVRTTINPKGGGYDKIRFDGTELKEVKILKD